jgi:hypothetical protein
MDLQNTINEVHRKIGKNLITIQKIEHLLKYIVTHSHISGPVGQIVEIKKGLEDKLSNQSMGQVLSQYLANINPDTEKIIEDTDSQSDSLHITFQFERNYSKERFEEIETNLSNILKERNDLVHHFILDFEEDSIDSCIKMEKKLDEQRSSLLTVLEDLQEIVKFITESKKQLVESGIVEKELYHLILVNEKTLLLELAQLSIQNYESDGWTSLGFAGKHIRKIIPEEVDKLKEKYGYKTLKPLVENTEIFELKEDSSKNIILYKLTADWEQHFKRFYGVKNL